MPYSEFCIVCQEPKIIVWLGRSTRRSWDVWLRFRVEALWDVLWFLIPVSCKYWRQVNLLCAPSLLVSRTRYRDACFIARFLRFWWFKPLSSLLAFGSYSSLSSKEELKHSHKKRESVFLGWTCPTSFYCFPSQSLDSWLVSSLCWSFGSRPTHQWIGTAGRGLSKIVDSVDFIFHCFKPLSVRLSVGFYEVVACQKTSVSDSPVSRTNEKWPCLPCFQSVTNWQTGVRVPPS